MEKTLYQVPLYKFFKLSAFFREKCKAVNAESNLVMIFDGEMSESPLSESDSREGIIALDVKKTEFNLFLKVLYPQYGPSPLLSWRFTDCDI